MSDRLLSDGARRDLESLWEICVELKDLVVEPRGTYTSYATRYAELNTDRVNIVSRLRRQGALPPEDD